MPSGVGVFQLTVPIAIGADRPTGSMTLPALVATGYGYAVVELMTIPIPVAIGTGAAPVMAGLCNVPSFVASASGLSGILGSGIASIPIIVSSGGQILFRGTGSMSLPQFVALPFFPSHGAGISSLAIPVFEIDGYGSIIPVSKVYRAIVMNISNQAISTYSGFNFNSIAYFNGSYYGASDSGIYLLGGRKDGLTRNILSKMKTGSINLGDGRIVFIRDMWITFRSDGHLQVTFIADENESNVSVSQTQITSSTIMEEKLKCGRGLKGRFYSVVIENMSGSNFDIEQIAIMVEDALRGKTR